MLSMDIYIQTMAEVEVAIFILRKTVTEILVS